MDDVEGSWVTFTVDDRTHSPQVPAASDHAQVSRLELDVVYHLSSGNVNLDSVIDLDKGVRIADGAAIVCGNERDSLWTNLDLTDLAELVLRKKRKTLNKIQQTPARTKSTNLGLLSSDTVDGKPSLDIINQSEELTSLFDGDNICKIERTI